MQRLMLIAIWLTLLSAVGIAGLHFYSGQRILSVESNSMHTTFERGDAVVISPVRYKNLHIGDVVSYRGHGMTVSHRIIALIPSQQRLITKGDALRVSDPPINGSQVIGRVDAVAPTLGSWLARLRTPFGLALMVYLPLLIILTMELRQSLRIEKGLQYSLN